MQGGPPPPREHDPRVSASSAVLPKDMLHETCPEDLAEYQHHTPVRAPTALLLFGGPLAVCAGVVLVGALHAALGHPLGEAWAAEVWSLAKTAITATMVYVPFAGYVRRHNERAQAHALRVYQPQAPPPMAPRGTGGISSAPSSHGRPIISPTGRYRALGPGPQDKAEDGDRRGTPP